MGMACITHGEEEKSYRIFVRKSEVATRRTKI
jgi:hypothetical protein